MIVFYVYNDLRFGLRSNKAKREICIRNCDKTVKLAATAATAVHKGTQSCRDVGIIAFDKI